MSRCVASPRSAHDQIAENPHEEREGDRAADGGPREPVDLAIAEAVTGVPHQMADATKCVVDQGPRVAEQDHTPDEAGVEPLYVRVYARARRGGDQPPGNKRKSKIENEASDAVKARH